MAQDISAQLALETSEATGGGRKPFIRHGKYYELLVTRCHSKEVKLEDTRMHRFAFMEFQVLKCEPHAPGVIPVSKQSPDDGTKPNPVGSICSNSIDFDGKGAPMAGRNVKEFIAGFFGEPVDALSPEDVFRTWVDLSRKEDVRVGGVDYVDPKTGQPVIATKDKVANMGCGYVIGLSTECRELKKTRTNKELKQEDREYFTQKNWICIARPGTGINSPDLVAKRRAEILLQLEEDEDEVSSASVTSGGTQVAPGAPVAQPVAQSVAQPSIALPQTPLVPPVAAAPAPPAVSIIPWPPPPPWKVGAGTVGNGAVDGWLPQGYVWKPGMERAITIADYQAGRHG